MQNFLAKDPQPRDNGTASNEAGRGGVEAPDAALTTDAAEGIDMADGHSISGKAPAFQFYPNDFLSDANVIVMSMQERGVYITLICICWQQGSLPMAQERLAPLCRMPLGTFRKLWPAIEPCFRKSASGDRYVHSRLERERRKQREYRKSQSDKGKLGGRPKKPELSTEKATAFQNESQTPENIKAEKRSSVFDLQSSSSDFGRKSAARGGTGGVMAGSLPRDHVNCRQPCIRVCITQKQHAILRERHGGTDADLDAFYADVRARLEPDVPIGDRPWEFWDKQFAARFGSVSTANPKTAGNVAAAAAFVARGRS